MVAYKPHVFPKFCIYTIGPIGYIIAALGDFKINHYIGFIHYHLKKGNFITPFLNLVKNLTKQWQKGISIYNRQKKLKVKKAVKRQSYVERKKCWSEILFLKNFKFVALNLWSEMSFWMPFFWHDAFFHMPFWQKSQILFQKCVFLPCQKRRHFITSCFERLVFSRTKRYSTLSHKLYGII